MNAGTPTAQWAFAVLAGAYACVLLALLLGSVVGSWPFPALWPDTWTLEAWRSVLDSAATVHTTLWLAVASSGTALVWVVAWLEFSGAHRTPHMHSSQGWRHALLQCALYLPLVLPSVLWVAGLHQMALAWGIGGTAWGVWLAHTLACVPYVYLALVGPYAGVSQRGWHIGASLGHGRWTYLWRIQWPLLRAALWSAFAVGCAVSVAQYLPTLYVGAGRFATVTTEAVTLASGGQRSLAAAFAWLQWLLPVLVFAIASRAGRSRRFARINATN
jgi:putative thiamine transport system permease protein